MANKISELKSAIGAGARGNKYRLNFSVPGAVPTVSDLQNADILCKSTTFPSMEIGQIEAWNQGRKLVIPGDTTYQNTWDVEFYNTEAHDLRRDMISWAKSADHFQNNEHSGNPNDVMTNLSVAQLDSKGNETVRYTFHNVFVQSVGEITVADDTENELQVFTVTFSFTDWVVGNGELNEPSTANPPSENSVAS